MLKIDHAAHGVDNEPLNRSHLGRQPLVGILKIMATVSEKTGSSAEKYSIKIEFKRKEKLCSSYLCICLSFMPDFFFLAVCNQYIFELSQNTHEILLRNT